MSSTTTKESQPTKPTKFIINDSLLDYRGRLLHLNLLPLMMELEIANVMFLKSLKFPSDHFCISDYLQFCSHSTRACHSHKLKYSLCKEFSIIFLTCGTLTCSQYQSSSFYNHIHAVTKLLGSLHINFRFKQCMYISLSLSLLKVLKVAGENAH